MAKQNEIANHGASGRVKGYAAFGEDERARVIAGECLAAMRAMPGASVDAIVTDPPYCSGGFTESQRKQANGQGLRSETLADVGWFDGDKMGTSGITWLLRSIAFEACRVLKPTGTMSFFTDWRMVSNLQPAVESAGMQFRSLIVWDKEQPGLGFGFRAQHELILHFAPGKPEYHDKSTGNVIRVSRERWEYHQTQKPVDLMRRLIRVVAPEDGVVLDPFMGSGSTGVAALREDRRFIGIDRNESYCETARKRLDAEASAPTLFDRIEADDDGVSEAA